MGLDPKENYTLPLSLERGLLKGFKFHLSFWGIPPWSPLKTSEYFPPGSKGAPFKGPSS